MGGAYFAGCGLLVLAAAPSLLLCGWMTVRACVSVHQLGQPTQVVEYTRCQTHTRKDGSAPLCISYLSEFGII